MDPEQIKKHPAFQEMTRLRMRMAFMLTAAMLLVFCLFFGLLAYRPAVMGIRLLPGSPITFGFWFSFFIIIFSILASGFYIWWANNKFDVLKAKLLASLREDV